MKLSALALLCLLVAGMWLQDVNGLSLQSSASKCCFNSVRRKILPSRIRCYRNPPSSCSHKDRIILEMKRGQKNCALKTDTWVVNTLHKIKECLTNGTVI